MEQTIFPFHILCCMTCQRSQHVLKMPFIAGCSGVGQKQAWSSSPYLLEKYSTRAAGSLPAYIPAGWYEYQQVLSNGIIKSLWSIHFALAQLPSRTLEVELTTLSSNYHVEMNPSDVGNNDRHVVQEIIKVSHHKMHGVMHIGQVNTAGI